MGGTEISTLHRIVVSELHQVPAVAGFSANDAGTGHPGHGVAGTCKVACESPSYCVRTRAVLFLHRSSSAGAHHGNSPGLGALRTRSLPVARATVDGRSPRDVSA